MAIRVVTAVPSLRDNGLMGLFASRPEEPFEWAGLPSEPVAPKTTAEYLEDPPVDPFAIGSNGAGPSITIAVGQAGAVADADDAEGSGDDTPDAAR